MATCATREEVKIAPSVDLCNKGDNLPLESALALDQRNAPNAFSCDKEGLITFENALKLYLENVLTRQTKIRLKEKSTWFVRISVTLLRDLLKMNPTNLKHLGGFQTNR